METSLLSRCLKTLIFVIVFAIVTIYIVTGVSSMKDDIDTIKENNSRPTVADIINGNY